MGRDRKSVGAIWSSPENSGLKPGTQQHGGNVSGPDEVVIKEIKEEDRKELIADIMSAPNIEFYPS